MGQFIITIKAEGSHGCERGVKDGGNVLGCQRPDCPDCIAREMVRRLKRNGAQRLDATLTHWPIAAEWDRPAPEGTVTDNLVTGIRSGSF